MTHTIGGPGLDTGELLRLGTATLYEASGQDCYLPPRIRPAWPGAAIVGRALPVRTGRADNLALHRALESALPGDVLVVDGGQEDCGYWGEVLSVAAMRRGVSGLVIDGGVRDVRRLSELGFAVFSSSIAIRTTVKQWPGTVGDPIRIGSASIRAGDLVVADDDGIVVVPSRDVERVVAAARARASAEHDYLERIAAGELTLDIYGFRSLLPAESG